MPPNMFFLSQIFCRTGLVSCTNVGKRNSFSKLLLKRFWHIWPWWPWPSDPIINRVPLLPRMDVWTKFEVGQRVLQLLIGNEKVTDGQTDRPTCAKQYALSSSKGSINIVVNHFNRSFANFIFFIQNISRLKIQFNTNLCRKKLWLYLFKCIMLHIDVLTQILKYSHMLYFMKMLVNCIYLAVVKSVPRCFSQSLL